MLARRFGKRLKYLRKIRNLTQSGLAERVGVTMQYLGRVERGLSTPSFAVVEALCRELGVEPANLYLFNEQEGASWVGEDAETRGASDTGLHRFVSWSGTWTLDLASEKDAWSPSIHQMLGYAEPSQHPSYDFFVRHVVPRDRERIQDARGHALQGGMVTGLEFSIRRKDGEVRDLLVQNTEVETDEAGEAVRLHFLLLDVTDWKELKRSLVLDRDQMARDVQEMDTRLARSREDYVREMRRRRGLEQEVVLAWNIVASTSDMLAFVDADLVVRHVNTRHEEFFGLPREKSVGFPLTAMTSFRRYDDVVRPRLEAALAGREVRFSDWVDTPAGPRFLSAVYTPHREDGRVVGVVMTGRDETERKQAEEAYTRSEKRFRLLAEFSPDIVFLTNKDQKLSYVSPSVEATTGFAPEEYLALPLEQRYTPESVALITQAIAGRPRAGVWDGEPVLPLELELEHYHKLGGVRVLEVITTEMRDESGAFQGVVGMARDMTERKQAVEALARSERRYRTLLENNADAVYLVDDQGRVLDVNQAACAMLGGSREQVMDLMIWDIDANLTREAYLDFMRQAPQGRCLRLETCNNRLDGGLVPVELDCLAYVEDGQRFVFGICRDITERKAAEAELCAERERYALALAGANDGLWDWDRVSGEVFFSPRWKEIIGYRDHEIDNRIEEWTSRIHPEDRERVLAVNNEFMESGGSHFEVEYRLRHKDGGYRWILGRGTCRRDETGACARMAGAHTDITARKDMEQRLLEGERRYRALFEQAGWAVFVHDEAGRILDANPRALESLGYDRDQLLGLHVNDVDVDRALVWDASAVGSGRARDGLVFESTHRRRDNTTFPVEVHLAAAEMSGERVLLAMVQDITERKAAEERLKKSETRFRLLAQHSPDVIFVANPQQELTYVSPSVEANFGYSPEEYMAMNPREYYTPASQNRIDAMISKRNRALARGEGPPPPVRLELEHRHKGGGLRDVEVFASEMYDSRGEFLGSIGICRDITERKAAEEALREAKEEALAASEAKTHFLASMSHDIRTPLNGLTGMLQLLEMTSLDEEQNEFVGHARTAAQRLLHLINDILDLSRVEAGRLAVVEQEIDLHEFLMSDLATLEAGARDKGLSLVVRMEADVPRRVVTDPVRLGQILHNLVGNAVKFTSQGEVKVGVALAAGDGGDPVLDFSVSDTGPGLPESVLERLFEPFVQQRENGANGHGEAKGNGSHHADNAGSGLGLSIVKRLCELLGGEVSVDSQARGTVVRFTIPARPPGGAPALESRDQGHAKDQDRARTTWPQAEKARGARVLVVDDDAINRAAMERMLERCGLVPILARDGAEALDILETKDVDMVLMDVQMPVMDGLEACRNIRGNERLARVARIPVVALTAHVDEEDRRRCLEAGMDSHLPKPVDAAEMVGLVEELLPPGRRIMADT